MCVTQNPCERSVWIENLPRPCVRLTNYWELFEEKKNRIKSNIFYVIKRWYEASFSKKITNLARTAEQKFQASETCEMYDMMKSVIWPGQWLCPVFGVFADLFLQSQPGLSTITNLFECHPLPHSLFISLFSFIRKLTRSRYVSTNAEITHRLRSSRKYDSLDECILLQLHNRSRCDYARSTEKQRENKNANNKFMKSTSAAICGESDENRTGDVIVGNDNDIVNKQVERRITTGTESSWMWRSIVLYFI